MDTSYGGVSILRNWKEERGVMIRPPRWVGYVNLPSLLSAFYSLATMTSASHAGVLHEYVVHSIPLLYLS